MIVELADWLEVVAIITKESAERLNLAEGKEVDAAIRAGDVMIATDGMTATSVNNRARLRDQASSRASYGVTSPRST